MRPGEFLTAQEIAARLQPRVPFPITAREADGRYVVRYGRHASYAAEADEDELVHATPEVIDALAGVFEERRAQHEAVDAAFIARLRALEG